MRKLSKILALVLALMMLFAIASMFTVSAAQPEYLYLTPNANWKTQGARFAAYFFGNGETWVSMTDSNGDGVYEVKVPTDKVYPNVIFCRMNPNAAANNWNNKWNQTADLTVPTDGPNHYTVKEGTWDKGGGTWSTFGSTCEHKNLGEAATCTTAQVCLDCGDPVVSALGHTYNSAHLCTRCNEQATFTVAGSGAHLGTEWDTGNTANDMTYANGVYTKVYTNVAAGTYAFKVARDHDWGTAYPSADKSYTVATAGSTVTITLKGTTVNVVVEAPHTHDFSDATCTEAPKCECGETQGEALGHDYVDGVCSRCEAVDPDYVPLIPGAGTEEDPFVIGSLEALIAFRDSVNAGETDYNAEGVYVVLGADIDMAEVDWSVNIGDDCSATFDGIFDGKGHKILNLNAKETAQKGDGYVCAGLFGAIYGNAVIKNLTIENVSIDAGEFTGNNVAAVVGFVYAGKGSIENVTVCGKIEINAPGVYGVGAIIGYAYSSNITVVDCKVVGDEGSYINAVSGAGAVAGYADGVHVANAEVSGLAIEGKGLLGGIFGIALGSDVNGATVSNVALNATKAEWVNGTGIVVGTIASKTITVSGVTSENVTGADTLVGSKYAEQPTTVVPAIEARIGDVYYASLVEALKAANGGTVVVLRDIALDATIVLDGASVNAVLDLDGHTIDAAFAGDIVEVLWVKNGATLTITGNGTMLATGDGEYVEVISATDSGKVTIENGTFVSNGCTTIYATRGAIVTINGGRYEAKELYNGMDFTLDINEAEENVGIIVVNGGSFVRFNPANHNNDGVNSNKLAEGLHVIAAEGVYTVGAHVWADATCTAPQICVCGATQGTALGHSYSATVTAPTCIEAGYTTYTCACGHTYNGDEVAALGHKMVAGEVVAPTFDAEGYTVYTCSDCGATEKRDTVPALVAVAQIGETKYASLAEAIAAAVDGDTIKLIENSDLGTGSVTVKGKELTLDLNGHNITGSGYRVLVVDLLRVDGADKRGVLTLTGEGTVKNTGTASGNSYAVYVGGSSDLIVKTGVTLNSDYGFAVLMAPMGAGRTSTITLDGGSITGRYGVSGNGTLTDTSTSVTINSGSIECTEVGIYQPQPGTVTINGGTISGAEAAIALRRGEATIEGGTIVGLVDVLGDFEASSLAINGGDFTGATLQYSADKGNTLTISGGTFAGDVSNYLADGYHLVGGVVGAHAFADATCTAPQICVCGATQGTALGHTWEYATCTTPDTCSVCGLTEGEARGHADANPCDHECDWCGASVSDCLDENKNHNCDICGDVMSKCTDADKNHFCDICGVQNSHCIDIPPYDHNCDWCGEKMSEHTFEEGKCTVCGADDPNYEPPHTHKDTGLDAKCDECGEWFLPTSPFKLEMYQASKKQTYYFTGAMNGYYFATSTDITKAVDLYAEEVDGGYNVYFMSGTAKKYIYIELSGSHINAKFGSTKAVWYVDPTYGCLTTEINGTKYFLGTYSNYVTFGGTAYSRLTASTADVSQYVGRAVSLENHECTNTTATVTAPTCTAQGYTTYKCADCGLSTKGDYVDALGHDLVDVEGLAPTCTAAGYTAHKDCSRCDYVEGKEILDKVAHTYENCVCTACQAVLPTLELTDAFDFTTEDGYNAAVAGGKLGFVGTFRSNGDSYQFNTTSTIQFVVPANTAVTITGHSAQYGVFNVYLNGEKTVMTGALTFTVTEETKVVIATGDEGASYSYIKGIVLAEHVDRTIVEDTTINFGSEGNYKDSIVDFSGITIGDNGGNNSLVKEGSFDLVLKAGSKVVIHGYSGYTSYKLNDGEEITSEYYTYLALEDTVLTVTPVNGGSNYFYSIEVTLHTGVTLVEAVDSTCTVAGHEAYYSCECHGELTEKVVRELALHTEGAAATCTEAQTCTVCGAELVAALGHDLVDVEGLAPTCTEAGYTAHKDCSRCDYVEGKEVVEATGHTFVYGKCACGETDPEYVPYVNTLVVGETNKIVVDGDTFNDYNLPIEWVAFVADEKATYTFVGNNNALVFIFDAEFNILCGGTGSATLEAGTYLICIGNGVVGELNVSVTKTALPHEHVWSDATCTEPAKCECGETQGEALGHDFAEGKCTRCEAADPDYQEPVDPQPPVDDEPAVEETEEPSFFENIWNVILSILDWIANFFKGFFKG